MQTITILISAIGCVFGVTTFVVNRKDKAVKDTKENHQELIEYQLKELKDDVKAILSKMDKYEMDLKDYVKDAIELHVKLYHRGDKNDS